MVKKGKKKGGRQKKEKKEEMTPGEAILAYKISLKDRELEELKFQLKSEVERKERNVERNERLIDERRLYMEKMLEKAKTFDTVVSEQWTRETVISTMKENWEINKREHSELVKLHREIKATEREIYRVNAEIISWRSYQDNDFEKQQAKIKILEQSILEMEESYASIATYLERKFTRETYEIDKVTTEAMEKQKDIAAEKAVKILDNNSKQEVMDHEWLMREERVHNEDVSRLMNEVEMLERENLQYLSELFECTVEDLKISKQVFLTQFHEDDNLDVGNLVEIDLNTVFEDQLKQVARPKSAIQLSVEQRYAELMKHYGQDDVSDEEDTSVYDTTGTEHEGESLLTDILITNDWEDCLDVGPLELKMLCVTGSKVKLHHEVQKTAEEEEAQLWNPDKWPVSKQTLASTLKVEPSDMKVNSVKKRTF